MFIQNLKCSCCIGQEGVNSPASWDPITSPLAYGERASAFLTQKASLDSSRKMSLVKSSRGVKSPNVAVFKEVTQKEYLPSSFGTKTPSSLIYGD